MGVKILVKADYYLFNLFIGNKSSGELTNVSTCIGGTSQGITMKIKKARELSVMSMKSVQFLLALKISEPFEQSPHLILAYNDTSHRILLPITYVLSFRSGQFKQAAVNSSFSISPIKSLSLDRLAESLNFAEKFDVSYLDRRKVYLTCEDASILVKVFKDSASIEVSSLSSFSLDLLTRLISIRIKAN